MWSLRISKMLSFTFHWLFCILLHKLLILDCFHFIIALSDIRSQKNRKHHNPYTSLRSITHHWIKWIKWFWFGMRHLNYLKYANSHWGKNTLTFFLGKYILFLAFHSFYDIKHESCGSVILCKQNERLYESNWTRMQFLMKH